MPASPRSHGVVWRGFGRPRSDAPPPARPARLDLLDPSERVQLHRDARRARRDRERTVRHGAERKDPHHRQQDLSTARGAAGACRHRAAQDHGLDRAHSMRCFLYSGDRRGMVHMRAPVAVLLAVVSACSAAAESWPSRPIRAIVPFSAGSASDIIPRVTLEQVSAQLGQPIVVENRVGASGTIGVAAVAKAEPDGYTLLANSGAHTITPWTMTNLAYDVERDFVSVAPMAILPNVLVIAPSKGIKTARELVEAARAKPGSMTYASAGAGSATHVSGELFRLSGKFEAVHVPFKGGPEALTEGMMGRVDFYFVAILPALQLIREGKLLALAVSTSRRSSALPEVPTTLELGFPNSEYNFWVGLFLPAKTPKDVVARMNDETRKAVQSPVLKERFGKLAAEPMVMTQGEFDDFIRKDIAAMGDLAKASGLGAK